MPSDLIDGLILLMNSDLCQPINLVFLSKIQGNPYETKIINFAKHIQSVVKSESEIIFCENMCDDPKRRKPNIEKATTSLNWQPKVNMTESITYDCNIRNDNNLMSSRTISDRLTFFGEDCIESVIVEPGENISRPGLTVEIDEAKFDRRKFNWVVGGIFCELKDVFLVPYPDNKRNSICMIDIINQNVHPDSMIITDCWKGYDGLKQWRREPFNPQP
ncbi:hypothetical protein RF11_07340 [Thelohanellus kitauei]|uniref:ISXO2-like transposase domain-containing protein n=1 Tax=Thelohanellus kitauei TaxID=669202 RepID=A0A0C2MR75_THEKT|nr:hypothetical protein RF11_07340 [Thelohanellus kitauei]